jgi:myo-inositol-hexaphosphate 3-phosphohydrolase
MTQYMQLNSSSLGEISTHYPNRHFLGTTLKIGLLAGLVGLSACSGPVDEPDASEVVTDDRNREVLVTAAFEHVEGDISAVNFLPNSNAASLGLIVSSPREGGLDLFNSDGELVTRHAGPRLAGIATAPAFQLRGESLPLVFGSSVDTGALLGYAVVTERRELLELPLAALEPVDGVSGLCLMREGAGFVELAILGVGASAEIWRVMDLGQEALGVEQVAAFALPSPARQCVADDGDLIVASPAGGLARVGTDGQVYNQSLVAAGQLSVGDFNGAHLILVTNGTSGEIEAFGARDFEPYASITVVDGLSTPGISQPAAIAITDQSYGFTAYASGLVGVFDAGDERIKVISREAFARALIADQ